MEKVKHIIIFFSVFVLYLFLNIEFSLLVSNLNLSNHLYSTLIKVGGQLFIAFTLILIYYKDFIKDKDDFNKNGKSIIKTSLKYWVVGLLIMIFTNAIINIAVGAIADNEAINRSVLSKNYIYAIISMVLVAPICEEIIFRLAIGKFINNKYIYPIISGLVFGYAHIIGSHGLEYLYIIPYAALGISFACLYKKTNNIFSTISMHILHNLVCVIILTI